MTVALRDSFYIVDLSSSNLAALTDADMTVCVFVQWSSAAKTVKQFIGQETVHILYVNIIYSRFFYYVYYILFKLWLILFKSVAKNYSPVLTSSRTCFKTFLSFRSGIYF